MARKLFLSILGTGRYMPCKYSKDGMALNETKFIQQALLEYLQKSGNWDKDGKAVIFLTEKARKIHWTSTESDGCGLENIIKYMGVSYEGVPIPDGVSTDQMWTIFETIYSQFEEDDELYIDITHSFRYLPMLLVVLVNYAKLLKNVSVAGIYYGNWEAKDEQGIAPVMDLLPLSLLQDWTVAASDFLQYGQIRKLYDISNASLVGLLKNPEERTADNQKLRKFLKILQNAVNDRLTCRGKDIMEGVNAENLRGYANEIEDVTIKQLKPIFEKIKESLSTYGGENEMANCIKAARWCLENSLYQQCITLLEEGFVTILCAANGLDYRNIDDREIVNKCIAIASQGIPEDRWNVKSDGERLRIEDILAKNSELWDSDAIKKEIPSIIELRNDYNHAGFKANARKADKIVRQIKKFMEFVEKFTC